MLIKIKDQNNNEEYINPDHFTSLGEYKGDNRNFKSTLRVNDRPIHFRENMDEAKEYLDLLIEEEAKRIDKTFLQNIL